MNLNCMQSGITGRDSESPGWRSVDRSGFCCHAGTGLDNDVTEFKCGRWAQVNDLYAGDAQTPWLDFCQVAGNQCTPEGEHVSHLIMMMLIKFSFCCISFFLN